MLAFSVHKHCCCASNKGLKTLLKLHANKTVKMITTVKGFEKISCRERSSGWLEFLFRNERGKTRQRLYFWRVLWMCASTNWSHRFLCSHLWTNISGEMFSKYPNILYNNTFSSRGGFLLTVSLCAWVWKMAPTDSSNIQHTAAS